MFEVTTEGERAWHWTGPNLDPRGKSYSKKKTNARLSFSSISLSLAFVGAATPRPNFRRSSSHSTSHTRRANFYRHLFYLYIRISRSRMGLTSVIRLTRLSYEKYCHYAETFGSSHKAFIDLCFNVTRWLPWKLRCFQSHDKISKIDGYFIINFIGEAEKNVGECFSKNWRSRGNGNKLNVLWMWISHGLTLNHRL